MRERNAGSLFHHPKTPKLTKVSLKKEENSFF